VIHKYEILLKVFDQEFRLWQIQEQNKREMVQVLQRLKERRDEMTSSEEQRRLKETYCFVEAIRSQIRTQDAIRALVHHMLHARDAA